MKLIARCYFNYGQRNISLSDEKADLLYVLANRNPNLATSPDIWRWSVNKHQELWNAIARSGSTFVPDRKGIVRAILQAGIDDIAAEVVKHFREEAIIAVLEWYDENARVAFGHLGQQWVDALKTEPDILLKWIDDNNPPQIETMVLMTRLLDPTSLVVLNYGAKIWLNLSRVASLKLDKKDLIETMALILAIGFNNPGEGAEELVLRSFEIVHDAAANNQLEYYSWKLLEKDLPSLSWWRDWDKCERLRRGLVQRFINHKWAPEQFFRAIKSKDTLQRIVNYWRKFTDGNLFREDS